MRAVLQTLTIRRFRNVAPGTTLRFDRGTNVLLGINGSGKTTLLELIAAVRSGEFGAFPGEPLDVEFRALLVPHAPIPGVDLPWTRGPEAVVDASYRTLGDTESQHFVLRLSRDQILTTIRIDAHEASLEADGRRERVLLANWNGSVESLWTIVPKDPSDDLRVLFGGFRPTPRFREGLEDFDALFRSSLTLASPRGAGSLSILLSIRPDDLGNPGVQLTLGSMLGMGQAVARAGAQLGFVDSVARMRRLELREGTATYGDLGMTFVRSDGTEVNQRLLSFGQKRLLAFVCYLAENHDAVIADELTNGFHHAWIRFALDAINDRQAFLATQNPLLLEELEFTSTEEVAARFIRCTVDRVDGREVLTWRNFTDDEARRFFAAYETGIQHVSEVLRVERLW